MSINDNTMTRARHRDGPHRCRSFRDSTRFSSTIKTPVNLYHHAHRDSAGVGRTGTYMAIDRICRAIEDMCMEPMSVRGVVADMRRRRNYMVQTGVQYVYREHKKNLPMSQCHSIAACVEAVCMQATERAVLNNACLIANRDM